MKFDLSQDFSGRRCTKRDEYGNADIKGVDMQFMLGLDYEQMNTMQIALNRLADFEDAQTHGKRTETHTVCSDELISRQEALSKGICWNCKHLKRHNGELAEYVCDIKGAVVSDTRIRECDEMWEERQ